MESVSDEEFKQAEQDNRHEEIARSLRALTFSVNQRRDAELIAAVDNQSKAIATFVETLTNLPKPTLDNTPVVGSVQQMGATILQGLTDLKVALDKPPVEIKPTKWEFTIIRTGGGYIQSVIATPK